MQFSLKKPQAIEMLFFFIWIWALFLQFRCAEHKKKIMPWYYQEIGPTMKELGIPTLEELGYDKPELWKEDVLDM